MALDALAPQLSGPQVDEALATAPAMGNEEARALALTALARQVSGEAKTGVLDEALAAARAIEDRKGRLYTLLVLSARTDPRRLVREVRRCLLECLDAQLAKGSEARLLQTIIRKNVVRAPIMGTEAAAALARNIIEVGHSWRWL